MVVIRRFSSSERSLGRFVEPKVEELLELCFFCEMTAAIGGEDCVLVAVFANVKISFATATLPRLRNVSSAAVANASDGVTPRKLVPGI